MGKETFEEWRDENTSQWDEIDMDDLRNCWNHQQKKIDELEFCIEVLKQANGQLVEKVKLIDGLKRGAEAESKDLEAQLAKAVELIDCTSDKWGRCNCKSCQFLETLRKGG